MSEVSQLVRERYRAKRKELLAEYSSKLVSIDRCFQAKLQTLEDEYCAVQQALAVGYLDVDDKDIYLCVKQ